MSTPKADSRLERQPCATCAAERKRIDEASDTSSGSGVSPPRTAPSLTSGALPEVLRCETCSAVSLQARMLSRPGMLLRTCAEVSR